MTLDEIRALVVSADAHAQHYESRATEEDYTTWRETGRLPYLADDQHLEGWRFQVDRFARDEHDPVAAALFAALDADDRVAVQHLVDYERDTGYIHHIFDCEGW